MEGRGEGACGADETGGGCVLGCVFVWDAFCELNMCACFYGCVLVCLVCVCVCVCFVVVGWMDVAHVYFCIRHSMARGNLVQAHGATLILSVDRRRGWSVNNVGRVYRAAFDIDDTSLVSSSVVISPCRILERSALLKPLPE